MKLKALVLENNRTQRDLVPKLLKDLGYSVMCVSSADDALNAADEFEPDLIIADAATIDSSEGGISRCKRILESAPGTSLILILENSDDHLLEECAALSPIAIIRRPIDLASLSRVVSMSRR
jgi:CheY-like chemotaxis protein